jgi:hypothetical protein
LWDDIYKNATEEDKNLDENEIKNRNKLIIKNWAEICKNTGIKELIIINIGTTKIDYIKDLANNIKYYDLSDSLIEENKKHTLSFKYDPHYNEETNNFIGNKVIELLNETLQ